MFYSKLISSRGDVVAVVKGIHSHFSPENDLKN